MEKFEFIKEYRRSMTITWRCGITGSYGEMSWLSNLTNKQNDKR